MPRIARTVIPGVAHHITQRGNNRQDVFFVDDDRQVYLELLHGQCQRYAFAVTGYCLMTNHVHLIGIPEREDSLAKAIGRTHFLYTQYINKMHNRSGHLWQNRYHSCPLDDAHALQALCYTELNPVSASMVSAPWEYRWSSAAPHCDSGDAHPVLDMEHWRTLMPATAWREILQQFHDDGVTKSLQIHTRTGRPLGSDSFISKVESLVGCRLRPLPVGRPRGSKKALSRSHAVRGNAYPTVTHITLPVSLSA